MNRAIAAPSREAGRAIVSRTRGRRRGPATRLMSPSDLGELLKPFAIAVPHFLVAPRIVASSDLLLTMAEVTRDAKKKSIFERAAKLERRSVTDFCLTALTEAARKVLERHESLSLSEADRAAFFDAPVHPPKPNARLRRALREVRARIEP